MSQHEFFVASNGDVYRDNNFSTSFRKKFSYTFGRIDNTAEFKATLRNSPHAWPGWYPMFLYTNDGAALCFECARKEARQIIHSIRNRWNDGWRVVGCDINYEDMFLYCDHCGDKIESAYGDDEGEEE